MMERDRAQKRAESLEKTIQNHTLFLKKAVEAFQKKCLSIFPQKSIPLDQVIEIRDGYKEIRNRLTEVKATQQLVQEKYRSYARKDPVREKELNELEAQAETCYSKFEYTLIQLRDEEIIWDRERTEEEDATGATQDPSSGWFRSKENQEIFVRNLQTLRDVDREKSTGAGDRREIAAPRSANGQSFTLFVFTGDPHSLDELQIQIHLRERDIIERTTKEELRGVLIHLKEVDPSEMESILQRFMKSGRFSHLKCLLLRMQSHTDVGREVMDLISRNVKEMAEGDVVTLSI
jgi:hypothetical protein